MNVEVPYLLEPGANACITPRCTGQKRLRVDSNLILALEVPRSWALPHAVVARGHWRFYARNSAGKYPLDVGELRGAFEFSASARERIAGIRTARLAAISAGEAPVPIETSGKTVLHIIPLNSLDPGFSVDPNDIASRSSLLRPINWTGRLT